jgi:hypothetical protein
MRLRYHAAIRQAIESVLASLRPSPRDGGDRYRVDPLEPRTLLSMVPVTLNIGHVIQLSNPDSNNPFGGDGDYYANVKIGDNPVQTASGNGFSEIESSDFNPNWSYTEFIDNTQQLIPVQIELFDSDVGDDQRVDINSGAGTTLNFDFDTVGGTIEGHATGNGDGDGDAEMFFRMFFSRPVTFTMVEFQQIDSPEPLGGEGNYKYSVKFDDHPEQTTGDSITYPPGRSNFAFTEFVEPTQAEVKIRLTVDDVDPVFNDRMDINPRSGVTQLTLIYDLATEHWREEGGAFAFPTNSSQGDGDEDRGKVFFNITPGPDTDEDGLLDFWETFGIDVNFDGITDITLNSDPLHKDLFVEADSMIGRRPSNDAMNDVVAAFAAAPNSLVHNPDGHDGITLHVQLDESNIPVGYWPVGFPEFDVIKQNLDPLVAGGFGTPSERASANRDNILAAKRMVYRYSIFADSYGTDGSSGQAELGNPGQDDIFGGNDFFVTLGAVGGGSRAQQSGAFMHELGHTLGLFHGGHQSSEIQAQYKPNYHSVMNYIWSFPYPAGTTPSSDQTAFHDSWILDYSRAAFNDLDENHLNESTGIGGHAGHVVRLRNGTFVPESGPVDWDGDGSTDDVASKDLNGFGTKDIMEGSEDWSHLVYNFRETRNFADGAHFDPPDPDFPIAVYEDLTDSLIYAPQLGNGADRLTLRLNGGVLEVVNDATGLVVDSRAFTDTRLVQIFGNPSEDDTLTIDYSGGFFVVPDGIEFDGGNLGHDTLRVIGTGASTGVYTPSSTTFGSGLIQTTVGGNTSLVSFSGLEPVEVSGFASFTLTTPNSNDVLSVSDGVNGASQPVHTVSGTSGGVGIESISFFNVTTFTIDTATNDGGSPNDTVSVSLSGPAAGVTTIQINTGAGSDVVNFDGDGLTYGLSDTSFTTATRPNVGYGGVETLNLADGVFNAAAGVSADVNVNSGATLAGIGSVTGATTVNTGGTVSPGLAAPGTLTTANTVFTAGGTFNVQLNGLTPSAQFGVLQVNGTINLGGATLTGAIGGGFVPVPGDEFVIIRNDGTDAVTGTFSFGNGVVVIGGKKFIVDYNFAADPDGVGNDVALIGFGAALAVDPCNPKKTALFVSATTGDDVIRFVSAAGSAKIRVLINGDDQGVFSPSGTLIGFGQSGNDRITVEVPSKAAWLYGQNGDDTLAAGNGESLLLGGLGDDELTSGNGKDVLIGGLGADLLSAGNGDDLLIAGATDYDANSPANRAALCEIVDEWSSGSGGYVGRAAHLTAGVGPGGAIQLNASTITNDSVIDQLTGGNGRDWFLRGIQDIINGKAGNETDSVLP